MTEKTENKAAEASPKLEKKARKKSKKSKKSKFVANRRSVRLLTHFGRPAQLVSKVDGTVVAEGFAAWAMHRDIFHVRISGLKDKG